KAYQAVKEAKALNDDAQNSDAEDYIKEGYEAAYQDAQKAFDDAMAALQKANDNAAVDVKDANAKLDAAKTDLNNYFVNATATEQKAYDDATAKVNDAQKALEDGQAATKKAQDAFNQANEFATDAAAAYNELKADHAENALNTAQGLLNKVQGIYGLNTPQANAAEALVSALKDYYLNPTSPADKTATLNKIQESQDVFNNLVNDANAAMNAAETKYQDAQKNADAAKAVLDRVNNGDFSDFPTVKDAEEAQKLAQTNYDNALANLKNAQANLDTAKANLEAAKKAASEKPADKPSTDDQGNKGDDQGNKPSTDDQSNKGDDQGNKPSTDDQSNKGDDQGNKPSTDPSKDEDKTDSKKDQNTNTPAKDNGTVVNDTKKSEAAVAAPTDKKATATTTNVTRAEYKAANKQNNAKAETLPQTGNESGVAAVALGAAAAMFGLGLAGKKREY
ncbi:LPXTG cell wall anchor domain-containing protein, partial [Limosilactobacillus reuteri]